MKINKYLIGIIIGILISCSGVAIAYSISSKDIAFTPTDPEWQVENVEEAMNSLYEKQNKSIGFSWCCSNSGSYTTHTFHKSTLPYVTITAAGGSAAYKLQFIGLENNAYISDVILGQKYDINTLVDKKVSLECTSSGYKCLWLAYSK